MMRNNQVHESIEKRIQDLYLEEELLSQESSQKQNQKNFTQWSIMGDGSFLPTSETVKSLESGLYEPYYSDRQGQWGLMKVSSNTDELFELPTKEIQVILNDLKEFWNKRTTYLKYKLVHKRGILLYGDPGCGKSGILQLCMKHIIEELSGLVINLKDEETIRGYMEVVQRLREIEPDRPIIVIIEDIDAVGGDNNWITSQLLNMLDGVKQIQNVVYIATTNYPEKLAERFTNRPSRFDRRYYIPPPSSEVRLSYLKNKIGEETSQDLKKWVSDTEGMSLSHLKELFISVFLLDISYEETLTQLKELKKTPRGKGQKTIGFGRD
jgi:SpoVK/Ycf46/Vps4 family AAA+-type ATPase